MNSVHVQQVQSTDTLLVLLTKTMAHNCQAEKRLYQDKKWHDTLIHSYLRMQSGMMLTDGVGKSVIDMFSLLLLTRN